MDAFLKHTVAVGQPHYDQTTIKRLVAQDKLTPFTHSTFAPLWAKPCTSHRCFTQITILCLQQLLKLLPAALPVFSSTSHLPPVLLSWSTAASLRVSLQLWKLPVLHHTKGTDWSSKDTCLGETVLNQIHCDARKS